MQHKNTIVKALSYSSLFFTLTLFVIFSCKKEDSNNTNNNNNNGNSVSLDGNIYYLHTQDYFGTTVGGGCVNADNTDNWFNKNINTPFILKDNFIYFLWANTSFGSGPFYTRKLDAKNGSILFNNKMNVLGNFDLYNILSNSIFLDENNNLFISIRTMAVHLYKFSTINDTIPEWDVQFADIQFYPTHNIVYTNSSIFNIVNDTLFAINKNNGTNLWKCKITNFPFYTANFNYIGAKNLLLLDGNNLYFNTDKFYCIDKNSGNILWVFNYMPDLSSNLNSYTRSFSIENNKLVFAQIKSNKIYILNKNTGLLIDSTSMSSQIQCSPTIIHNKIYVSTKDSILYCLDGNNLNTLWQYKTNSLSSSQPIVKDSLVWIATKKVLGINKDSGIKTKEINIQASNSSALNILAFMVGKDSIYYPGGIIHHK